VPFNDCQLLIPSCPWKLKRSTNLAGSYNHADSPCERTDRLKEDIHLPGEFELEEAEGKIFIVVYPTPCTFIAVLNTGLHEGDYNRVVELV
jgi:hypothetical protein